jgi:hypothetical protein
MCHEGHLSRFKYQSAWLADLAMAFLLVTIDQNVFDKTKNFGIYCDNGIAVFPGTWMQMEVHVEDCLSAFQRAINDKAGNNKLSFTAEVWTPGRDKTKVGGKVGTQTTDQFPFLDMELSWSVEGTLKFYSTLETEPTAQCRECSHSRLLQSNHDRSLLPTDQADHNQ